MRCYGAIVRVKYVCGGFIDNECQYCVEYFCGEFMVNVSFRKVRENWNCGELREYKVDGSVLILVP